LSDDKLVTDDMLQLERWLNAGSLGLTTTEQTEVAGLDCARSVLVEISLAIAASQWPS
jgi:hypothetical protein